MIAVCERLGVAARRNEGWTGVWTDRPGLAPPLRKLASIGIAVRRWVTFHGLALNVSTDLAKFGVMNPCGLEAQVMTSLGRELGRAVTLDEVKPLLADALGRSLGRAT
jgi:lipoyl(octanoyl) transferase